MAKMHLSGARMVKRFFVELKPEVEMKPKFPGGRQRPTAQGFFYCGVRWRTRTSQQRHGQTVDHETTTTAVRERRSKLVRNAMDLLQQHVVGPLQPVLRPVVESLPEPVHDALVSLIGSPCHEALVVGLDLTKDPACTSLAISKALGVAIVGASAIVKVPQILKLVSSQSSAGVSFVSYALETASLLITLSYGVRNQFPFSTYGESALIAVQDVVVGVLVLSFAGRPSAAAAFVAAVAAGIYALLVDQNLVDAQTMALLQAGAGALSIASKAPQIYTIWSEGGTGQLSAFAVSTPGYYSYFENLG